MVLIVKKFGGTSVANTERIREAARLIGDEIARGNQVIGVVSAMSGVTNQLVDICSEVSNLNMNEHLAEYDTALCSGEIVTASLLAMQLQKNGLKARSVLAWQLPIITSSTYSKALVKKIEVKLLNKCLDQNIIPILAGFQGITADKRITTLGRGGSDTTAALIAARMKAHRCDIYTDVEGVFTTDPRVVSKAKILSRLSFEEMLELACSGAKVLAPRCVAIAMRYHLPLRVLSSFASSNGTLITEKNIVMENRIITGIASNKNLLKVVIKDSNISHHQICLQLAQSDIYTDLMWHVESANISNFLLSLSDVNKLENLLIQLKKSGEIKDVTIDAKVALVSLVGHGIKGDKGLVVKILGKLEKEKIKILMMQTSEIKISLLIPEQDNEKLVSMLHEMFKLDE